MFLKRKYMNDKSKKKPVYETPVIMPLAGLSEGSGQVVPNCGLGSGASSRCQNGSSASARCIAGNYAVNTCSIGSGVTSPSLNCRDGGLASSRCTLGDKVPP